jgi:hypothetical protein
MPAHDRVLDSRLGRAHRAGQPARAVDKAEAPTSETHRQNTTQESKIDRRPFAEQSLEELRDRARELEIEGRSAMSKDELIAAVRQHAK